VEPAEWFLHARRISDRKVRLLYLFSGGADGNTPQVIAPLIFDNNGNLYGTTFGGGAYYAGTVFQLVHPQSPGAPWTENVLYSFGATPDDGVSPQGGVIFDNLGNLFGTTSYGLNAYGTVFELSPPLNQGSTWTESVLYRFMDRTQGSNIYSGVVMGGAGKLYGTAADIPPYFPGTVFEVSPPQLPGAAWTGQTIYTFTDFHDGSDPRGSLIAAPNGDLYGTTTFGGVDSGEGACCGTVFKLVP